MKHAPAYFQRLRTAALALVKRAARTHPQPAAQAAGGRDIDWPPMSERGTAVVAEVAWVNGLAAIRSLGRHGLRVLALDHRPYALGFRSRYAEPRLAPDPLDDEQGFIAALHQIADETDGPLPVFPTHDEHVNAIARNADALAERYRFPFPSWEVLERIQSKRHQLETAEAAGLPVPRTFHPASLDEALAAGEELGFPVIVKPSANVGFRRSHGLHAATATPTASTDAAAPTARLPQIVIELPQQ